MWRVESFLDYLARSVKLDANGLALEALVLEPNGLCVGDSSMVALPPDRISLLKNDS